MKKIRSIIGNSLFKDSFKLATSHFVMFFLPLIVTPILSRIYMPEHFGEWGVFSSTFYIISVVLFLCYEYAIIKVDQADFPSTVMLCTSISFVVIVLTFFLFWGGNLLDVRFFSTFEFRVPLIVDLFITSFTKVFDYITNRYEMYWVMSAQYFVSGLTQAVFRICFGYILLFDNGLIAGTICSQIICLVFYLVFLLKVFNRDFFRRISVTRIKRIIIENKKFPLYDTPSTLLSYAALNLPVIILSFYFSKAEIGCFSIIVQLLLLPMSLIGSAIGRVYYQQISSTNDISKIQDISLQVLKVTVWLAIIPTLFLASGGDKLVELFLGDRWITVGPISLCLALWSIPTILTQPLLPIFRKKNMQEAMFKYDGIYFLFGIGTLLLACFFNLDLYSCILCFAVGCFFAKNLLFFRIVRISEIGFLKFFNGIVGICYLFCLAALLLRLYYLYL